MCSCNLIECDKLAVDVVDLHCDTITACLESGRRLDGNNLQIDISRSRFRHWIQTFALWIYDGYQGEDAFDRFIALYNLLKSEMNRLNLQLYRGEIHEGCNVIIAIEGGHLLNHKLERVALLKSMGISYLTLVWNADNELAGCSSGSGGLTDFGKLVVRELELVNIIVDVSHMNQRSFWDLCEIATKPIIASHSNAFSQCGHLRNLHDDQLRYLIAHDGLCGINFYDLFLCEQNSCSLDDFHRHIEHILSLGGEDILALGSDFDGVPSPNNVIPDIGALPLFFDNIVKWYSETVARKIFFDNAKSFIDRNIM